LAVADARETFCRTGVLLTGANGFLGKVLLGFLFDRYPEFRKLCILIRPRPGTSARERFETTVLASPALRDIVARRGREFLEERVELLEGDLAQPLCGLSTERIAGLAGEVGLVINCAGLVEFFPPVDESFRSNVDGVEQVVALTRRLKAKLLHVSTCFVCGEADGLIEETEPIPAFYPRRKGAEDHSFDHRAEIAYVRDRVRQIRAASGERRAREINRRLTDLGRQRAQRWGWVNTYTYAKSIGEQIIATEPGLEYAIVRPAIVECATEFPFPGWVEGGRTAAPLILMAMAGLRHWTVREDSPLEVVPVDMVASSILTASALLMAGTHKPVYHVATAHANPVEIGFLIRLLHRESKKRRRSPRVGGVRIISVRDARQRRQRLQRQLRRAQSILSRLRGFLSRAGLPGTRPLAHASTAIRSITLKTAIRDQTLELYRPFVLENRFVFETENIRAAYEQLSERDRSLLPWGPERINWEDYWTNKQVPGVEKWVQPEAFKDWTF
jgi:long-chain acyl-CoA synthetase